MASINTGSTRQKPTGPRFQGIPVKPRFNGVPVEATPSGPWTKYQTQPAANFFDQFDQPPKPNFFDQFDSGEPPSGPWTKYGKTDAIDPNAAAAKVQAGKVNPVTGNAIPDFVPMGKDGKPLPGYDPVTGNVDHMGFWGTAGASMAEGVPIAGPLMDKAAMAGAAEIGSLISGDPYAKVSQQMQAMRDVGNEEHPLARLGGHVAGGLAVLGPLGATEAGGWALGTRGVGLGGRMLNSALSSGGINAADTLARGGSGTDALESGVLGLGLGGVLPVAGAGIKSGIGWAGNKLAQLYGSLANPASEAERRFGSALVQDARNPALIMTPADEAAAQASNVPLTNVDRGGETTRALARSVANQSPEVRGTLDKVANDRYAAQSQRASAFVSKIMGGNADDIALQEQIKNAARLLNKPAYDVAFAHPNAQAMWGPELQQLMQAPAMQEAAQAATKRGANRSAVEGFQAIKNPFVFAADGSVSMKPGVQPTLRFWDQVKRNLDGEIGKAARAGDDTLKGDLTALKTKLVSTLDTAVPQYKTARQGAAGFFQADDAVEAGKKFARSPGALPEATKAHARFNSTEKQGFAVGYASELIDKIKNSRDSLNVINSTFKNQAARESVQLALGPTRARQVEAYVRVETLVDRLRGSLGNSTTARQLTEMGIGAGIGGYYTGDWSGAGAGALVGAGMGRGGRYVHGRIEQNIMRELGKLLTADDPALVQRLITNASLSPKYMTALENVQQMLAVPSRELIIQGNRRAQ